MYISKIQLSILGTTVITDIDLLNTNSINVLSIDFKKYKLIDQKNNKEQRISFLNLIELNNNL